MAHFIGLLPRMSVFVRWWEVLFPVVAIGAALNAYERERAAGTWPKTKLWRRALSWILFAGAWGTLAYVAGLGAHYYLPRETFMQGGAPGLRAFVIGNARALATVAVAALPVLAVGGYVLLRRFLPRVAVFLRHWVLGKRFWLGFGFLMHIGIDVGMNVGTFAEVMMAVYLCWLSGDEIEALRRYVYSQPCAAGEGGRPVRKHKWVRLLLAPWDRLRYRKPGRRYVVRHHPDDPSVRRAALLRLWDVGHRLEFEPDEAVPPQTLAVQVGDSKPMFLGNAAAGALTNVIPGLLWLRPFRFAFPAGASPRIVLRQRA